MICFFFQSPSSGDTLRKILLLLLSAAVLFTIVYYCVGAIIRKFSLICMPPLKVKYKLRKEDSKYWERLISRKFILFLRISFLRSFQFQLQLRKNNFDGRIGFYKARPKPVFNTNSEKEIWWKIKLQFIGTSAILFWIHLWPWY